MKTSNMLPLKVSLTNTISEPVPVCAEGLSDSIKTALATSIRPTNLTLHRVLNFDGGTKFISDFNVSLYLGSSFPQNEVAYIVGRWYAKSLNYYNDYLADSNDKFFEVEGAFYGHNGKCVVGLIRLKFVYRQNTWVYTDATFFTETLT